MIGEFEEHIEEEVAILTRVDRNQPKQASLMMRRPNGNVRRVRISDQEVIDTNWVVGEKYRLNHIELRRRSDGGRFLFSSEETSVSRISHDAFDFLVLGDTHFGYRNRTTGVDTRYINGYEFDVLDILIELSEDWNVDGILHTGDLFDHEIGQRGFNKVKNAFSQLEDLNVKILFVMGNHDVEVENRVESIASLPNVVQIDKRNNWGNLGGVNVVGIDSNKFNSISDFEWSNFEREYGGPNIFLAHPQEVSQDKSTFEELSKTVEDEWCLFLGHSHEEEEFNFNQLSVFFTGFPAKLDDTGSVWRLRGGNGQYNIEHYYLEQLK